MLPLAYHADDEIVRWWITLGAAGAVAAIALTIAVSSVVDDRSGNRFVSPHVALALAALTGLAMLIGVYPVGFLISLLAPIPGIRAVTARGRQASRRLALSAFLASLLAFALGTSAFGACVVTDACFH